MTNLQFLIAKLNPVCREATEKAAAMCVARTHYEVDLEHLLLSLVEARSSDAAGILKAANVDDERLIRDLQRALDRMKTGNSRSPTLSPRIVKLMTEAWTIASIDFSASQIRSGMLLLAMLSSDDLVRLVEASSPELLKLNAGVIRQQWSTVLSATEGIPEAKAAQAVPASANADSKTPALAQYTNDLTEAARRGEIDPVIGRDAEIRQLIDVLTRRRQNNPILTGEAGVGKTAIVEGLAIRVVKGDVPPVLRDVSVRSLDMGLLQAGAGIRGEFENRLKSVIAEVKSSPKPIILFIDEAHTLIGGGGQAGVGDAANLLKPALARGELRTIAATTQAEYRKYFEKDAALARRFQMIKVEEPAEELAIDMMRALAPSLQRHHRVRLLDEAVEAAVRLSHRYVTGRQLPDKAVSVLDSACARVSITQNATPPMLEDRQRQIAKMEFQVEALEREVAAGADHAEQLAKLADDLATAETQLADLEDRYNEERRLVKEVNELRQTLEQTPDENGGDLRRKMATLTAELTALQGETPLVHSCVDARTIAEVISSWTGIPVGRMLRDEIHTVLNLKHLLGERIVGQEHALQTIAKRIRTARAGIEDQRRPTGVFLLVGPSGVGKTETALALADVLYGGERNTIVINMSEYQEAYSVSALKGSPPGYVGYGEGGVLTEAVRRRPYSVVLLDEMEKAHQDVIELFYQVFDKGRMEDSEGREIDFRNTIILMTSNIGSATIQRLCSGREAPADPAALKQAITDELRSVFKPALLGRVIVVPYYPISDISMRHIVELKLERIRQRLLDSHKVNLEFGERLVDEIARRCVEVESGARNVDHILTGTLLPELSRRLLCAMADRTMLERMFVDIGSSGAFRYQSG
ncbi:MAG: type VI secretion system ATPase TssH [Bryobacterales bacterium]|nr:type VI secretion system ATPase TssH [Bryobacterales bacterium]